MFICGNKPKPNKVNLDYNSLEPIIINFNGPTLKFDIKEGNFKLVDNQIFNNKNQSIDKVGMIEAQCEDIRLRIDAKHAKKQQLLESINKIKDNIEVMTNLLKCDLCDKSYLEELKNNAIDYKISLEALKANSIEVEEINVKEDDKNSINHEEDMNIELKEDAFAEDNQENSKDNNNFNTAEFKEENDVQLKHIEKNLTFKKEMNSKDIETIEAFN
jgi:hypothetical protein